MRRILGIVALSVVAAAAGCQSEIGPADYVERAYPAPVLAPPTTMSQNYLPADQQGAMQQGGVFVDPSQTQASAGATSEDGGMIYVPADAADSGYSDGGGDVWVMPTSDNPGFGGYPHRDRDHDRDHDHDNDHNHGHDGDHGHDHGGPTTRPAGGGGTAYPLGPLGGATGKPRSPIPRDPIERGPRNGGPPVRFDPVTAGAAPTPAPHPVAPLQPIHTGMPVERDSRSRAIAGPSAPVEPRPAAIPPPAAQIAPPRQMPSESPSRVAPPQEENRARGFESQPAREAAPAPAPVMREAPSAPVQRESGGGGGGGGHGGDDDGGGSGRGRR